MLLLPVEIRQNPSSVNPKKPENMTFKSAQQVTAIHHKDRINRMKKCISAHERARAEMAEEICKLETQLSAMTEKAKHHEAAENRWKAQVMTLTMRLFDANAEFDATIDGKKPSRTKEVVFQSSMDAHYNRHIAWSPESGSPIAIREGLK